MKKFENRIVIVTRATRLEKVLESQNTISQARFYVNQLGSDFDEYEAEHNQYGDSLRLVRRGMEELGNIQLLDRKFLPNFMFSPDDMVVVVGQDGLVANTLKYLAGQPVIGINPDSERWDGVLLPFKPADASRIVEETILGRRKYEEVTMARASVQNGQELLAVNDFFIGQKTHTSARYVIKYGGLKESQSSSGVIVSTGLGSTGWMKSVLAGASRISASVIGRPYGASQERDDATEVDEEEYADKAAGIDSVVYNLAAAPAEMAVRKVQASDFADSALPLQEEAVKSGSRFLKAARLSKKKKTYGPSELSKVVGKWSSGELIFAVREPFPSKTTGTNLVFGTVSMGEPLRIESLMGENGVIFSDGIESDFISFNSGTEVIITLADKRGKMVV
jgi:NAD kinase